MSRSGVFLLNPAYQIIGRIDEERAIALVVTDRARILFSLSDKFVQGPPSEDRFILPWPTHVVLRRWVNVPYHAPKVHEVFATRMGVLRRDGFTCGYCGEPDSKTIDHVIPQSKGGEDTWSNLITACQPCNAQKANRTPEQAGMKLLWNPKSPNTRAFVYEKEQERVWKLLAEHNVQDGLDMDYDEG